MQHHEITTSLYFKFQEVKIFDKNIDMEGIDMEGIDMEGKA